MANVPKILQMPAELRLNVYKNLIASSSCKENIWLPLLFTCRTIRGEVEDMMSKMSLYVRIPVTSTAAAIEMMNHHFEDPSRLAEPNDYYWDGLKGPIAAQEFAAYCRRFRDVILDLGLGDPFVAVYLSGPPLGLEEGYDRSYDHYDTIKATATALERTFAQLVEAAGAGPNAGRGSLPKLRILWYWNCSYTAAQLKSSSYIDELGLRTYSASETWACALLEQVIRQEQMRRRVGRKVYGVDDCLCIDHTDVRELSDIGRWAVANA
ncbi:uncharacterized protein PV09_07984 [Verruconis gallopava]|uniref:F-box domain-containing protein n=1 Tax=Verruconis gallopava TaxID=253628 RepID=A0A0D2AMW3_9PEZI|nr:uncharacterized protein PV09_07984 [Verruconis gallopava]KIW00459.1 hypothetical protein PV09_07984 [Verruconis gallopava]